MTDVKTELSSILKELKLRKQLPMNMDVAQLGSRYWFVCHDQDRSNIISETSTTGFADDPTVALLKALSERVERQAFRNGYANKVESCMTERSDGFAAYPAFYDNAKVKVRESALAEAIERYAWATWWDDKEIDFTVESFHHASEEVSRYLKLISSECDLKEVLIVNPKIENSFGMSVVILLGCLKDGGFISGGACGSDNKSNLLRSMDELYRHGLAIKKMKTKNIDPVSFYEKRLAYFGFGHGSHLVTKRLEAKGNKAIALPSLQIDDAIEHELQDLFHVHRCYFKNQPPFIGGAMERLCL